MRKWFNMAVLLVSGIVLTGCASNVTSTVTVGFSHGELINEIDGTGDNNGWGSGRKPRLQVLRSWSDCYPNVRGRNGHILQPVVCRRRPEDHQQCHSRRDLHGV